jgi:hypothetical protein
MSVEDADRRPLVTTAGGVAGNPAWRVRRRVMLTRPEVRLGIESLPRHAKIIGAVDEPNK